MSAKTESTQGGRARARVCVCVRTHFRLHTQLVGDGASNRGQKQRPYLGRKKINVTFSKK